MQCSPSCENSVRDERSLPWLAALRSPPRNDGHPDDSCKTVWSRWTCFLEAKVTIAVVTCTYIKEAVAAFPSLMVDVGVPEQTWLHFTVCLVKCLQLDFVGNDWVGEDILAGFGGGQGGTCPSFLLDEGLPLPLPSSLGGVVAADGCHATDLRLMDATLQV